MTPCIKTVLALVTAMALAAMVMSFAAIAHAAPPAPGATGYATMVVPILGTYSGNRSAIVSWTAPMGYQIQSATASVRAATGTNPTLKVRGKNGAYVNYSGTISTAGTSTALTRVFTAATASDVPITVPPRFAAGSLQTVDLVVGGTAPKFSDLTLTLFLRQY